MEYTNLNIDEKIHYVLKNYSQLSKKMSDYPFSSYLMSEDFLNLFLEMYENKNNLISKRIIEKSTYFEKKLFKLRRSLKS